MLWEAKNVNFRSSQNGDIVILWPWGAFYSGSSMSSKMMIYRFLQAFLLNSLQQILQKHPRLNLTFWRHNEVINHPNLVPKSLKSILREKRGILSPRQRV